jgi:hypothetical protein
MANLRAAEVSRFNGDDCGNAAVARFEKECYQELGMLPNGHNEIGFRIMTENDTGEEAATGECILGVEVVQDVDQAFPAVKSAEADAAVGHSMSIYFENDSSPGLLVIDPDIRGDGMLAELGLSLDIEVQHDGEVQESVHLLPIDTNVLTNAFSVHLCPESVMAICPLSSLPANIKGDKTARSRWTVRVRGSSDQVWRQWHARTYWAGDIVISVEDLITREAELEHGRLMR